MSYIGRKPTVGNFQICDAISVVNGQAAYTMQVGSVNVIPQSANHMIVSLNGTIQKPNSSFTVSGSTITFASNLATGDVIDFIQILGDVLDLGVPSDATVTTAKLAADAVTEAKIADSAVENEHLNVNVITGQTAETSIATDDTILIHDTSASALRKMTRANFVSGIGGTMTPAFSVRQTTNQTGISSDTLTKISFQSEVFDTDNAFASDKFTVPSGKAGRYFFDASTRVRSATLFQLRNAVMYFYKNGSAMGDQYSAHYNSNLMLESRQNYSFVDDASVGDYYEIYATGTVDSGTVNLYQTTFTGYKIIE